MTNKLIISYAFPPSSTTTGNAMAKKVLKNKKNVDILYASLSNLNYDVEFAKILDKYITKKYVIDIDFNTSWENIKTFTSMGMSQLSEIPEYNSMYSMCHFIHSHFLAIDYKLKHPDTFWSAEFSDPIIYNFEGKLNSSPIDDEEYINKMNKMIPEKFKKINREDTLNYICEYLTFIFADEIIFTNENQRKVMLESFSYQDITTLVEKKSRIIEHNTLEEKYYNLYKSDYEIDDSYINFGYFGVIFGKRTLEDFVNAFDNLNEEYKDKFKLHIFTPTIILFEQLLSKDIMKNTKINGNMNYLEFLNICKKFDVLLVNDTETSKLYSVNPFLPSKLSDYEGSGTDVWAICEKDSIMDQKEIKYKSQLNDIDSSVNTLNTIFEDKLKVKIINNNFDKEKYLKYRIAELSQKINELVDVCESEFEKDKMYEIQINELNEKIQNLEKENSEILNSNSWKVTKNFRKIGKKFK